MCVRVCIHLSIIYLLASVFSPPTPTRAYIIIHIMSAYILTTVCAAAITARRDHKVAARQSFRHNLLMESRR